jgi:hypothetical protein
VRCNGLVAVLLEAFWDRDIPVFCMLFPYNTEARVVQDKGFMNGFR